MEQQSRSREARTREQTPGQLPQKIQSPERERRFNSAGLTAQLALEGVSLLSLPPRRLEELAGFMGNSAMQALLEVQSPQPDRISFRMPDGEPETEPFQVPEGHALEFAEPVGLAEMASRPSAAADPAALVI